MRSSLVVAGVLLGSVVTVFSFVPRIPQDPAYHAMADERGVLGIPNALNVLSNAPFAIVGALGLFLTLGSRHSPTTVSAWERAPLAALFSGVAMTAAGSAYYHLAPDNARLVWDRLPMTIGFMGLLAWIVAERVGRPTARRLFLPLLAAGIGSVGYWHATESNGAGDLRPYALVQFGSLAAVAVLLVLRPRYASTPYLWGALAAYAGAKVLESADREIYALGHIVSGHTLKHLVAGGGTALLLLMVWSGGTARPMERRGPAGNTG